MTEKLPNSNSDANDADRADRTWMPQVRFARSARSASLASLFLATTTLASCRPSNAATKADDFTVTVIAGGLDTPWDMEWGPDSMLWVSERPGRISRIDPRTGGRTLAGTVQGVRATGESGLT